MFCNVGGVKLQRPLKCLRAVQINLTLSCRNLAQEKMEEKHEESGDEEY